MLKDATYRKKAPKEVDFKTMSFLGGNHEQHGLGAWHSEHELTWYFFLFKCVNNLAKVGVANAKVVQPHSYVRTTLLEPCLENFEEGWEASMDGFERA